VLCCARNLAGPWLPHNDAGCMKTYIPFFGMKLLHTLRRAFAKRLCAEHGFVQKLTHSVNALTLSPPLRGASVLCWARSLAGPWPPQDDTAGRIFNTTVCRDNSFCTPGDSLCQALLCRYWESVLVRNFTTGSNCLLCHCLCQAPLCCVGHVVWLGHGCLRMIQETRASTPHLGEEPSAYLAVASAKRFCAEPGM
jgi:hypothetical protein